MLIFCSFESKVIMTRLGWYRKKFWLIVVKLQKYLKARGHHYIKNLKRCSERFEIMMTFGLTKDIYVVVLWRNVYFMELVNRFQLFTWHYSSLTIATHLIIKHTALCFYTWLVSIVLHCTYILFKAGILNISFINIIIYSYDIGSHTWKLLYLSWTNFLLCEHFVIV